MRLSDFLAVERAVVPLRAESLADAADALLERLDAARIVVNAEKLRQRIGEQRAEDVVVLADRAFVLHYRSDAVADLQVALGTAVAPIRRGAGSGGDEGEGAGESASPGARVVLMVVAPPRHAARHLQVVRGFVRLLAREEAAATIASGATADVVCACPLFAEVELPEQLLVRDLMSERPRTAHPDTPLREAARDMMAAGLGALPVVDEDGRLLGLLSERELVRHLLITQVIQDRAARPHAPAGAVAGHKTVRDVMTRQVLCVGPEQPIAEVASLMSNKNVERVPVVREGRLVGFLTRGDIVRKLLGP